jgi:uncharacterized membrane protein YbaN (DUF454 family)
MRAVYLVLGFVFFALGAIGAVVPGLPTTVFMLLALWAFARSSERFHNWLYHHPLFGPPLQEWHRYRVIPLRAKLLAVGMMAASLTYLVFFTASSIWLKTGTAAVMVYGAWYILSKPSARPVGE